MVTDNVKHRQFVIYGLKHAIPPVCSFKDSGAWAKRDRLCCFFKLSILEKTHGTGKQYLPVSFSLTHTKSTH